MSAGLAAPSQTKPRTRSSRGRLPETRESCIKWLRNCSLFEGLSDRQLAILSPPCRRLHYREGHILITEGEEATSLFVVLEGELSVEAKLFREFHLREGPVRVQRIGPGEVACCCALVQSSPKMRLRCTKDTELLAIDAEQLRELLAAHPEIGLIVMASAFKMATERLLLAQQHLLAQFGLREMYQTYRNY